LDFDIYTKADSLEYARLSLTWRNWQTHTTQDRMG